MLTSVLKASITSKQKMEKKDSLASILLRPSDKAAAPTTFGFTFKRRDQLEDLTTLDPFSPSSDKF